MKTFRVLPAVDNDGNMINKFGYNTATVAGDTIWALSTAKVDPVAAATLYISSSNQASDVGKQITVEYIDANGAHAEVTGTLHATDARTFVSLGVTGIAVNRAYLASAGALVGNVYVSNLNTDVGGDGIPDNLNNCLAYIPSADGQTQQAFYHIPNAKGGRTVRGAWLYGWAATLNGNTTATSTIRLAQRQSGGAWRTVETQGMMGQSPIKRQYPKAKFFPAGTFLKIEATAASVSINVTATLDVELAF